MTKKQTVGDIVKYSADQDRDENGRWTSEGGSKVEGVVPRGSKETVSHFDPHGGGIHAHLGARSVAPGNADVFEHNHDHLAHGHWTLESVRDNIRPVNLADNSAPNTQKTYESTRDSDHKGYSPDYGYLHPSKMSDQTLKDMSNRLSSSSRSAEEHGVLLDIGHEQAFRGRAMGNGGPRGVIDRPGNDQARIDASFARMQRDEARAERAREAAREQHTAREIAKYPPQDKPPFQISHLPEDK